MVRRKYRSRIDGLFHETMTVEEVTKLRAALQTMGMSQTVVSIATQIPRSTLSLKLNGDVPMCVEEWERIAYAIRERCMRGIALLTPK